MKKLMLCTLAILLALSTAIPASAQSDRRSNRHRGGYEIPIPQIRIVGLPRNDRGLYGYGHQGGYYDYSRGRSHRHNRGLSRGETIGVAAVIGATVIASKVLDRRREGGTKEETPSQCFERVVKKASAAEAMAFCGGQPLPKLEPVRQYAALDCWDMMVDFHKRNHLTLDRNKVGLLCSMQDMSGSKIRQMEQELKQEHAVSQEAAPEHRPVVRGEEYEEDITSGFVTNNTGECLLVDGQRLEHGQHMGVNDIEHVSVSTARGSTCRVEVKSNRQGSVSLFCK